MNTRITSKNNELIALKAMGLLGLLATSRLAKVLYKTDTEKDEHNARNKVNRVIKRLQEKKFLIERKALSGVNLWGLSKPGARFLNAELVKEGGTEWGHHQEELGLLEYERKQKIVDFLLSKENHGKAVMGKPGFRNGYGNLKGMGYEQADAIIINIEKNIHELVVYVHDTHENTVNRLRKILNFESNEAEIQLTIIGDEVIQRVVKRKLRR